jgi:tricorn protease
MDLDTEEVREVEVEVVTDRSTLRPRVEQVAELIQNFDLSPSGKRALFEARGEVFTVPAEHGIVRDLTRTSRYAERYPAWSPDGEWIAYLSDRSGEYELTVRPADGSGEERTLTAMGPGFRYRLFWSPDSSKIVFVDQAMGIHCYDLEAEELVEVDRGLYMYQDTLRSFRVSWSPDSRWLTYHRALDTRTSAVFLYDTREGARHQVTSGFYQAFNPTFGAGGDYLFLRWAREFTPIYSDFQNSWVYANSTRLAAVPLRRDVPSPLAPRNDEEAGTDDEEAGTGEETPEPVAIDLDGFESRLVVLAPDAGNYGPLAAAPGKLLYLRQPRAGAGDGPFGDDPGDLVFYDLEAREEKTVLAGVDEYVLAAGGGKVLVRRGEDFAIVDLAPDQKLEKTLRTAELEMTVDPVAEWRQLFDDAWRIERDYFYDRRLHGVDWQEMRERYGALLDHAVTRWDVNYVLGELLGELNASHAYRGGGDEEPAPERGVGLLGADFALDGGFYRIADVLELPPWETEARSPLREPGVEVAEGDYLLAVNGVPVDAGKDPWAAFQGLADQTVSLTVNDRPTFEGAREVLVRTLGSEGRLRNLAWIAANRRRVEEATGGRAGYLYVPSTGLDGQSELVRQFFPQLTRDALIVDERFNSGGQVPSRFIELLNRPLYNYWGVRNGVDLPWPPSSHQGPKVMLINGWAGSGGDLFPFYFRQAGLGPLIGRRTWGGLIGISGNPPLIDGGGVTAPGFAIYSLDGEWIIEGHGVEPDVEVIDDPAAMARGEDPQLERAIEEILRLLEESPPRRPERPAPADRSGV